MEHLEVGVATGAYSPGVLAPGPFLFVSGQGPETNGVVVPGTVAEQTRLALDNVEAVLAAAGATRADVVRCTVYLADIDTFGVMDAEFAAFFGARRPARTTVGAALGGISVEIDAIAQLPVG